MSIPLLRLRYFLWLVLPAAIWSVWVFFGTPHVIWSYSYVQEPPVDQRFTWLYGKHKRKYLDCTYLGLNRPFTTKARSGRCPAIRFFKVRD